jgi:hypothetical protein
MPPLIDSCSRAVISTMWFSSWYIKYTFIIPTYCRERSTWALSTIRKRARWVVIGKMNAKHWSAVVTRRGDNVRIISVRRSRDEEVTIYESQDV